MLLSDGRYYYLGCGKYMLLGVMGDIITWAVVEGCSKAHRSRKVHKADVYRHLKPNLSLKLQTASRSEKKNHVTLLSELAVVWYSMTQEWQQTCTCRDSPLFDIEYEHISVSAGQEKIRGVLQDVHWVWLTVTELRQILHTAPLHYMMLLRSVLHSSHGLIQIKRRFRFG